jgi:superfamily II DNA or RNA helicase
MNKKSKIQAECLSAIGTRKYSGAILGTGAGKTLLGLKHMAKKYTDTCLFLVVAPKLSIHEEWVNQAQEHGLEFLIPHMQFTTYISLYKASHDYDFVYLDECHNLKKKHGEWLRLYDGPVLGLTGTYPKYKTSESFKVCNIFCPEVFKYDITDGIADHMLNDYRIYVHSLELNKSNTLKRKNGGLTSEYKDYLKWCKIVENAKPHNEMMMRVMRMKAIQSYQTKVIYARQLLNKQTDKTLVFTDFTEQADSICNDVYHSKEKNSKSNLDKFRKGEITKLASVQQLAEGINIPELKVGIILHAYANEKKLRQKIGRFLRLNPNQKSIVHLLCYTDTIDLKWCKTSLKDFDKTKVFKYNGKANITQR